MVRGPQAHVGSFDLLEIDERKRSAAIRSTTPFNKDMERGVIIGGMSAPGDLDFVYVDNSQDPSVFRVNF